MEFIRTLFVILEALLCVMLIGIILLQRSKSEGLGLAFGSGMGESLFGARAGNVLSKATIVLGAAFLANTLLLGVLFAKQSNEGASLADAAAEGSQPVATATVDPMEVPVTTEPVEVPATTTE